MKTFGILPIAALCFIVLATAPAKAVEYGRNGATGNCFSIAYSLVDDVAECFGDVRNARFQREHRDFCKSYTIKTYDIILRCNKIVGECKSGIVEWFINGSLNRRGGSNIEWNANCTE